MNEGPGIYRDPDECPAVKRMQEQIDDLRREVQQLTQQVEYRFSDFETRMAGGFEKLREGNYR